jgi:hypothetical protein
VDGLTLDDLHPEYAIRLELDDLNQLGEFFAARGGMYLADPRP